MGKNSIFHATYFSVKKLPVLLVRGDNDDDVDYIRQTLNHYELYLSRWWNLIERQFNFIFFTRVTFNKVV